MIEKARLGAINRSQDAYGETQNTNYLELMKINDSDDLEFTQKNRNPIMSPKSNGRINRKGYLDVPTGQKHIRAKKMSLISPIIENDKNKSLIRYGTREGDDIFSREDSSKGGRESTTKKVYYPDTVGQRKRKSVNITKSLTYKPDFYAKDDG